MSVKAAADKLLPHLKGNSDDQIRIWYKVYLSLCEDARKKIEQDLSADVGATDRWNYCFMSHLGKLFYVSYLYLSYWWIISI